MDYRTFLDGKQLRAPLRGLSSIPPLSAHLMPFQREVVAFGLRAGSFGAFLDTGMGKTLCELEWAIHAASATNGKALILTPLAVAKQFEREGARFGYPARVVRSQDDVREGINICNYDRLHLLDVDSFGAVSADESSILKNFTGQVSRGVIASVAGHRFRCAASATPSPNDHTELAQQAAFLDVMTRDEMLVRWFINDSGDTKTWRLKGHAVTPFFDWMASWSRMAETPADLGDLSVDFSLPPMRVTSHRAEEPDTPIMGGLFGGDVSATGIHDLKRQTTEARADVAASLVMSEPDEPWLVWCDTDYEADALLARLPHALDVRGSHAPDLKETRLMQFSDAGGVIITKPSVAGFGMNWQHCARMVFVGRSFSYESWYQAVRRCWRYGQTRPVNVHLIVAEGEDAIGRVIDRKADDHAKLRAEMKAAMARAIDREAVARKVGYVATYQGRTPEWLLSCV